VPAVSSSKHTVQCGQTAYRRGLGWWEAVDETLSGGGGGGARHQRGNGERKEKWGRGVGRRGGGRWGTAGEGGGGGGGKKFEGGGGGVGPLTVRNCSKNRELWDEGKTESDGEMKQAALC